MMRLFFKRYPWISGITLAVVCLVIGTVVVQSYRADIRLTAAKKADNTGHYTQAQNDLQSVGQFAVLPNIKKQIQNELSRSQRLLETQQKIAEIQLLLKEHKTAAAKNLLQTLSKGSGSSSVQAQVAQLQKSAQNQTTGSSGGHGSSGSSGTSSPPASGGSGGSGGTGSGGGGGGGSGGTPPPGPLSSISVNSFTASASPATASTCNINDAVTFSTNGSGSVTTTWLLLSSKTTSQIGNPTTFSFSGAGSQSDSLNFTGTQGLESGDSYRVSVTITSVSNPSIVTTAGPVTISSCAAAPSLVAEQEFPAMTSITPGAASVYEYQDNVFPNECSVQVTTPYSVNSSGTVEAIVMVTSGDSIGYTYYDANGANGFTGPGSTSDTSYFRLPHLPSGNYTITVKLVEVSSPSTIYATTSPVSSGCA